ncbi:hypothetical protein LCGC14_0744910 [marine sediment metagenome]|uniref:Uncharacterized protein n=1 Tax=marine sediment metagenome TaxID=412755 RepID=A0A0F9TCW5_9ZZZZ
MLSIEQNLLVLLLIGVCVLASMFIMRGRFAKQAQGRIKCEFTTATGVSYCEVHTYKGCEISIPGRKDKITGVKLPSRKYYIREDATYDAFYPDGWPKYVQVAIKKAYFREGDSEPKMKRCDDAVVSPALIGALRDESTAQLAFAFTSTIKSLEEKLQKQISPRFLQVAIILAIAAGLGAGYIAYQNQLAITILMQAAGVQ